MRGIQKRGRRVALSCSQVIVAVGSLSWSGALFAGSEIRDVERVIYGADERVDAALHANEELRELSKSVAGRLRKSSLTVTETALVFPSDTLQDAMNVCRTERFAFQKTPMECTGFLVGADLLVTAGHCVTSQVDCDEHAWAFGFVDGVSEIKNADAYNCKEIVSQQYSDNSDFALIRLDRVVEGREPLKFRKTGEIAATDKLVVIGHPSGLPLKIDDGGLVRDPSLEKEYFVAELDTYGGNSGSPVFNAATLEVEGILVRGEQDYVWDQADGCAVSNVCVTGSCRGEDVQKITKVSGLQ